MAYLNDIAMIAIDSYPDVKKKWGDVVEIIQWVQTAIDRREFDAIILLKIDAGLGRFVSLEAWTIFGRDEK